MHILIFKSFHKKLTEIQNRILPIALHLSSFPICGGYRLNICGTDITKSDIPKFYQLTGACSASPPTRTSGGAQLRPRATGRQLPYSELSPQ